MSLRSSPRNQSQPPRSAVGPAHTSVHDSVSYPYKKNPCSFFPGMHLKFSRWRCLDLILLASEQQSTNQWVTSWMLRPFLIYSLWVCFNSFSKNTAPLMARSGTCVLCMSFKYNVIKTLSVLQQKELYRLNLLKLLFHL